MITASPRSSGFASRAAAAGLALCLGLTAASCGGKSNRERVDHYVQRANEVQRQAVTDLQRANRAYVTFSKGQLPPARAKRELAAAESAIRVTREQLAELDAPADGRTLRARLLDLFDVNLELAHEATLLAGYVPAAAATLQPLKGINTHLQRRLGSSKPADQVRALRRYSQRIRGVLRRLRRLRPPPILNSAYGDQLRRLASADRLSRRLASAVGRRDQAAVARLLLRFRRLAARAPKSGLDAGALAGYERRYRAVQTAAEAVQRERQRLDRDLPG